VDDEDVGGDGRPGWPEMMRHRPAPPPSLKRMTGQFVRAEIGSSELVGPDWRLALERPVEPNGPDGEDGGWRAVLGLRRGLKLALYGRAATPAEVEVEAWAGDPADDDTDGVAVVTLADGSLALAPIPLCLCGDRGCGNASTQLRKELPGRDLRELAELLRALPWTAPLPQFGSDDILRGRGLAALPDD
jgi:hypothetical protein